MLVVAHLPARSAVLLTYVVLAAICVGPAWLVRQSSSVAGTVPEVVPVNAGPSGAANLGHLALIAKNPTRCDTQAHLIAQSQTAFRPRAILVLATNLTAGHRSFFHASDAQRCTPSPWSAVVITASSTLAALSQTKATGRRNTDCVVGICAHPVHQRALVQRSHTGVRVRARFTNLERPCRSVEGHRDAGGLFTQPKVLDFVLLTQAVDP